MGVFFHLVTSLIFPPLLDFEKHRVSHSTELGGILPPFLVGIWKSPVFLRTGFLDQIQELLEKTMKRNILQRKVRQIGKSGGGEKFFFVF